MPGPLARSAVTSNGCRRKRAVRVHGVQVSEHEQVRRGFVARGRELGAHVQAHISAHRAVIRRAQRFSLARNLPRQRRTLPPRSPLGVSCSTYEPNRLQHSLNRGPARFPEALLNRVAHRARR